MMMNAAARKALMSAKARYEADGYIVSVKQRLPVPFDAFVADAIAQRGDEFVVVDVRSANMDDWSRDRLGMLREMLRTKSGWRLDILTYTTEAPPTVPDLEDIERRVLEARRLSDTSPDAAALLMWSAIEGALLRVAHRRDIAPKRRLPPRNLIQQLTIDGILSDNQSAAVREFACRRDEIAHGMRADTPAPEQFDWLGRFALSLARGSHADLYEMVVWFVSHYLSPDDAVVSDDRGEGQPEGLVAAPSDVEEVLRLQFEDALDADIDEAASLIKLGDIEWARRDQQ
ncbi:hypothetical protein [Candidatus Poriferisodalis sp.]|uniref:hypothetical protein n=1 Tax=Candidatus Poriferisodalis sp. TaxID=3101277 RepID=UPI003B59DC9B